MKPKFAVFCGSQHYAYRVTPFFDTAADAWRAHTMSGEDYAIVRPVANWREHQAWNVERRGIYRNHPVKE